MNSSGGSADHAEAFSIEMTVRHESGVRISLYLKLKRTVDLSSVLAMLEMQAMNNDNEGAMQVDRVPDS